MKVSVLLTVSEGKIKEVRCVLRTVVVFLGKGLDLAGFLELFKHTESHQRHEPLPIRGVLPKLDRLGCVLKSAYFSPRLSNVC